MFEKLKKGYTWCEWGIEQEKIENEHFANCVRCRRFEMIHELTSFVVRAFLYLFLWSGVLYLFIW